MMNNDTLIICFEHSDKDIPNLIVSRAELDKATNVINKFQGGEAINIYTTLTCRSINTIFYALASVAYYNGWYGTLYKIREYIKSEIQKEHSSKYWNIIFPNFLSQMNPDTYPCVIWSMLSEMFGNYGVSPRFGWIEGKKSDMALEWISALCELSAEEN